MRAITWRSSVATASAASSPTGGRGCRRPRRCWLAPRSLPKHPHRAMRAAPLLFAVGLAAVPGAISAQQPPDLARLFDLGQLVLDTNGDSVPDLLNASLVLGPTPSVAETAAATEIAARLGFETMALDLP